MVRDLRTVYDLPAQVFVHDKPGNFGVHAVAEHGSGIYIPESDHVRRYRYRADVGKYYGDGVAGRQDVHCRHHAHVGVRHVLLSADSHLLGDSFPEKQRFLSTVVFPDNGETLQKKSFSGIIYILFLSFRHSRPFGSRKKSAPIVSVKSPAYRSSHSARVLHLASSLLTNCPWTSIRTR